MNHCRYRYRYLMIENDEVIKNDNDKRNYKS